MAEYYADISWKLGKKEDFLTQKYSRGHQWSFDGGAVIQASSSPHVVPLPFSVEESLDPEEAFVASLSSCHMLWFLSLAARNTFIVTSYIDKAVGIMAKNTEGKLAMTEVTLRPSVDFDPDAAPSPQELEDLHHQAHDRCYIANSVRTKIRIEVM